MKVHTQQSSNPKPVGHSKNSTEGEVHSIIGLPKEDRIISNKQAKSTPKRTRKAITKPRVSRRRM